MDEPNIAHTRPTHAGMLYLEDFQRLPIGSVVYYHIADRTGRERLQITSKPYQEEGVWVIRLVNLTKKEGEITVLLCVLGATPITEDGDWVQKRYVTTSK